LLLTDNLDREVIQVIFFNLFFKFSYDTFGFDLKQLSEKYLKDLKPENDLISAILKNSLASVNDAAEGLRTKYSDSSKYK
jgi:hypothetical protein